jgi:MFS family permease
VAFAALRHPDFRPYMMGGFSTMMGDNVEHVISYWIIFQVFHSTLLAGYAIISHWLPFLLFSVWAGALADRFDCRRLIQVSQLLFLIASAGWGVLIFMGTLEVWHACVLLTIHGMAGVLGGPAGQLLIHDIVGREHLQSGVRLSVTARQLGQLVGPAIGGGLMLVLCS